MKRVVLALLLIAVAAPTATAALVTGEIQASSLSLPNGSRVIGEPLVVLARGDLSDVTLSLRAGRLHVMEYEEQRVGVTTNNVRATEPIVKHHNFTTALLSTSGPAREGIVGFYPGTTATIDVTLPAGAILAGRTHSKIPTNAEGGRDEDRWWYYQEIHQPHASTTLSGDARMAGAWQIKIRGPTVVVEANGGTVFFETGVRHVSPVEMRVRWLLVEFESGDVSLHTKNASLTVAVARASATWRGPALLHDAKGQLRTDAATYDAVGASATISGVLSARLVPERYSDGVGLALRVEGDLATTSLRPVPVRTGAVDSDAGWMLFGAGVVLAGGFAVYRLQPRRTRSPAVSAIEREAATAFANIADEAASAGRWNVAAEYYERARLADPTLPLAALREGIARFRLGEEESFVRRRAHYGAAIERFDLAASHSGSGEAEMWAAKCALRMGTHELAEVRIMRALDLRAIDPRVLSQIGTETEFEPLWASEEVRGALDEACRRMGPIARL